MHCAKFDFLNIVLFALTIGAGHGQSPRTVTARLLDRQSQKPISNASVVIDGTKNGTFTNHLGFFQLSLAEGERTLVFDRIGYVPSKVDVPDAAQFVVHMDRLYLRMEEINLCTYPFDAVLPPADTAHTLINLDALAQDAVYPGGWDHFYHDLAHILIADSLQLFNSFADSVCHIRFGINPKGQVSDVQIPEDSTRISLIEGLLSKLKPWSPARQNKAAVSQYFEISASWKRPLKEEIYSIVEEPATPIGGMTAFYKAVADHIRYPPEARRLGIEGRVFIEFVVNVSGEISDIRVVKGIGGGCDEEAARVVSFSPRWSPGRREGIPVRQRMIVPITFIIGDMSSRVSAPRKTEPVGFSDIVLNSIRYPAPARREGVEGVVMAKFKVDWQDSSIVGITLTRDIKAECGTEVVNCIRSIPQSIVATLPREYSIFLLPVSFELGGTNSDFREFTFDAGKDEKLLPVVHVVAIGIEREVRATGYLPISSARYRERFRSFSEAREHGMHNTIIRITNQELQEIPPGVGDFTSLKFLDLENNQIQKLPDELSSLSRLEELYLPSNHLSSLPGSFVNLRKLKILGLARNSFTLFPFELTRMERLEALDLAGNKIESIPDELINMKRLKVLYLQDNLISTLPANLDQLTQLEQLFLAGNPISDNEKKRIQDALKNTKIIF